MPSTTTWFFLFFSVDELLWNSNMWPYEVTLIKKTSFNNFQYMQHKSSSNNVLSYFHGNIHVTLSYGFLNWSYLPCKYLQGRYFHNHKTILYEKIDALMLQNQCTMHLFHENLIMQKQMPLHFL